MKYNKKYILLYISKFKTHVIFFLICVRVPGGNVWPDGLYDK
jgi:hypothetical protein